MLTAIAAVTLPLLVLLVWSTSQSAAKAAREVALLRMEMEQARGGVVSEDAAATPQPQPQQQPPAPALRSA